MAVEMTKIDELDEMTPSVITLWMLRLLVKGDFWMLIDVTDHPWYKISKMSGKLRRRIDTGSFSDLPQLASLIEQAQKLKTGISEKGDKKDPEKIGDIVQVAAQLGIINGQDADEFIGEFTKNLAELEQKLTRTGIYASPFKENLETVAELFCLSEVEKDFLAFVICLNTCEMFRRVVNLTQYGSLKQIARVFAYASGHDFQSVRKILNRHSALFSSVLTISFDLQLNKDFDDWFSIDDIISECDFFGTKVSAAELLRRNFDANIAPNLGLSDFDHISQVRSLLLPYLTKAVHNHTPGINVLLYGAPGTGKTQLSRVLAAELGADAYELATHQDDGDGRSSDEDRKGTSRIPLWKSANVLLKDKPKSILVIDEAEDVFSSGATQIFMSTHVARENKAFINKMLETNACPTIWLTNSLYGMDQSMIRRFDIVMEVTQPSIEQRLKIIDKISADTLSSHVRQRLAKTDTLSPAVISKAIKVANAIAPSKGVQRDDCVIEVVDSVLRAQGHRLVGQNVVCFDDIYSTDFVNTNIDLHSLAQGISHSTRTTLCLYGVPGTGKSAYAAWLAKTLDKPLIAKKASDLMSCYVGMTEQLIAQAFDEAKRNDGVLLIDEADSFLRDRTLSRQSWEVTQVNEMLTQMENFDGIFIATTNLVDMLDAASLRRFDLKVKFDYLTGEQSLALFERHVRALGLPTDIPDSVANRVRRQQNIAPGDFATVARQARFRPVASAEDFCERLIGECAMKEDSKPRTIGFC